MQPDMSAAIIYDLHSLPNGIVGPNCVTTSRQRQCGAFGIMPRHAIEKHSIGIFLKSAISPNYQ